MKSKDRKRILHRQKVLLALEQKNLQLSQKLDRSKEEVAQLQARSKEEVAQLQARCDEFWHHPEPTQYARDEGYLSQVLEWMQMEEHQPQSAATSKWKSGYW